MLKILMIWLELYIYSYSSLYSIGQVWKKKIFQRDCFISGYNYKGNIGYFFLFLNANIYFTNGQLE